MVKLGTVTCVSNNPLEFCTILYLIVPSLIQFSKHRFVYNYIRSFGYKLGGKYKAMLGHFFSRFLFDLHINALTFDYVACLY